MRRKNVVAGLLTVGVALATSGVAAAANGGFSPETPHSPNARHTLTAYWVIMGFTSAIFVIVESALIIFMWKYRSRGRSRDVEGHQLHGATKLEIIWTVIPVVILAIIGTVVFLELPHISGAPAADKKLQITVEGHQFYWQFDYPNGARSINDLYVPVNEDVELRVVSDDVVHSWWIPQLEGKIQAIPGRTNHIWFRADKEGTYYGQCAELCGVFHALMKARVIVTSPAQYRTFIATQTGKTLGKAEFQGVCATCHGMKGQGFYGPALASNTLLTQLRSLTAVVRNGFGRMPPVANSWTNAQVAALVEYTKSKIYTGATTSGG